MSFLSSHLFIYFILFIIYIILVRIVFFTTSQSSMNDVLWFLLLYIPLMNCTFANINFSHQIFTKVMWKILSLQMKQILEAHTDEVWFLQFSHDGKYLASSSKDQSAIIWEVRFLYDFWLVVVDMDFYNLPASFTSFTQC